ncbi:pilus assembly protein TadE [Demequina activiva]|uniref:TadE-like protein n=1 Tax=Demequina activiva TaxID=1582364 RepID=A0A919UFL9_9MICO|nr:pilus assembly protein TadE [Demequina activiva]GIG53832.1 hypothetical protein Dac01nite_05840 [Demequina activiva]
MSRARRDRGSVTVELAAALPAVVLVLGMVLSAVAWARAGVVAADAAAMGARIAAVEGADAAVLAVLAVAPDATVTVDHGQQGGATVSVGIAAAVWLPVASATSTSLAGAGW